MLMTADAVGGVWTYALDLAQGLAAHGVRMALAVLGPPPGADQRAAAAAVPGLTLRETALPLDWLAESAAAVDAAGAAVAAIAAETGAELVQLNSPALAAPERFRVPVVGLCHSCVATWWRAVRQGPLPEDFRWRAALLARGYAAADALVAPTRAFAEATRAAYRLPRLPAVVHNGRHAPAGVAGTAAAADIVFTAGRLWDEAKNLAALDRAARRLDVPVLAAGPALGPNGAMLAPRHLRLLGRLGEAELRRLLAARPVFVSAARYEPFGLTVLEAAQAGCALVLSDTPGFRELWDGAAAFIPPEDDGAIAATIAAVLRDRERRAALGAAARERARRYGVEAMTADMLGIYAQVLGRTGGRAEKEAVA